MPPAKRGAAKRSPATTRKHSLSRSRSSSKSRSTSPHHPRHLHKAATSSKKKMKKSTTTSRKPQKRRQTRARSVAVGTAGNVSAVNVHTQFLHLNRIDEFQQLTDAQLATTLFVTDFDMTVKFPDREASGNKPVLRGFAKSYAQMQLWMEKSWGYFLATARTPSSSIMDSVTTEMATVHLGLGDTRPEATVDLRKWFAPSVIGGKGGVNHPQKVNLIKVDLFDDEALPENESIAMILKDNLVLAGYTKAAGTIAQISKVINEAAARGTPKPRIDRIVFFDDYVSNLLYYPLEIMSYLNNLPVSAVAPNLFVHSCWLDPEIEIKRGYIDRRLLGSEDSGSEENAPARKWFESRALYTDGQLLERMRNGQGPLEYK